MKTGERKRRPAAKTAARRSHGSRASATAARPRPSVTAAEILAGSPKASQAGGRGLAKWRWHYGILLSLRDQLLREHDGLRHAVAEPLEPHSLDEADSATDEFDHTLALTRLSAEQDALCEVTDALRRIIAGTYGVCEESGRKIPAARLRAVPWTRFTREVEERLEKQGAQGGPRVPPARTVRKGNRVWLVPEEEAEENEEQAPPPPKDERLSKVFVPPGRHVARRQASPPERKPRGRKGRKA
jgi:DnaK suppressor protein